MNLGSFANLFLQRFGLTLIRPGHLKNLDSELEGKKFSYEDMILGQVYAPWYTDFEFVQFYRKIADNTLVDICRCWELQEAVRQTQDIPGDIIEIGTWRGGTGAVLARAAKIWKPDAKVYLFDTFRGVVKSGRFDVEYRGGEHDDCTQKQVADLLAKLELSNIMIHQGVFPDESGKVVEKQSISLCHIDVDAYQSARDILDFIEPLIPPGGTIIFDDYGFATCKGITRLVDEWKERSGWRFIYNLNRHAILIRVSQ